MSRHRYDCPEKQKHRECIAEVFAEFRPPQRSRVLILAGSKPHELRTLLARGFQAFNILAVDRNSQMGSNWTRAVRRAGLPACPHIWRELTEITKKVLATPWRADVAHFDFESNLYEGRGVEQVRETFEILTDNALICVTWLKAREPTGAFDLRARGLRVTMMDDNDETSLADRGRLRGLYEALSGFPYEVQLREHGGYWNTVTRMPMIWAVFHVRRINSIRRGSAPLSP